MERLRHEFIENLRCILFRVFTDDGNYSLRDALLEEIKNLSDESKDYLIERITINV